MVRISLRCACALAHAALRRGTVAYHDSVEALIDQNRVVEVEDYAAVVSGLIGSAEINESALQLIPQKFCCEGLSNAGSC